MKLRITLHSDTITGCGEGLAGIIDRDIAFNDDGFPYIPAKRLKGILRESALEYLEVAEEATTSEAFEQLFGKPGMQFSDSLLLSNGYLENYQDLKKVMDTLNQEQPLPAKKQKYLPYFHPEFIRQYYAYTRTQTTIDRDTDTAQDDTLRVSRVLKKELTPGKNQTFVCTVTFKTPPSEQAIQLLENACRITHHIGLARTRGFGEVKVELLGTPDAASTVKELSDSDAAQPPECCLPVTLKLQSQAVCSANVGGHNTVSDLFIPGSAILGAFAGAFRRRFGVTPDEAADRKDFRRLFLEGGVQFLPAYCTNSEGKRLLPAPLSIVHEKGRPDELYDFANDEQPDTQTKKFSDMFCAIEYGGKSGLIIETAKPEREIEYHHSRDPKDRSRGHAVKLENQQFGQFFQYEVLKADQTFQGLLIGSQADLELLMQTIPHEGVIRIGKSRTAQYGEAIIEYGNLTTFTGEIERIGDEEVSSGQFVITLTSPMILVNDNGFVEPDPTLFATMLRKRTGNDEITLEGSFLRFVNIGGFMGKWGVPRQQVTAIDAGSVMVLNNNGETIPYRKMEQAGYGLRTEQGYGRVVVDWHGNNSISKKPESSASGIGTLPDFPSAFKEMTAQILKQRLESEIREKAITAFDTMADESKKQIMTNSLLGKLLAIFRNQRQLNDILEQIGTFKDIARDKLCTERMKIGAKAKPLLDWLELYCKNDGELFYNDVVLQTPSYQQKDAPIAAIRGKLDDDVAKIVILPQLVRIFFMTIFTHCELHNRRAKHE